MITTANNIVQDIKDTYHGTDRTTLTLSHYLEEGKYSHYDIYEAFGAWNNALEQAGITPNRDAGINVTKTDVIMDLVKAQERLDKPLSWRLYDKEGMYSTTTARRRLDDPGEVMERARDFDPWIEIVREMSGWYDAEDFVDRLGSSFSELKEVREAFQEELRDNGVILRRNTGKSGTTYYIEHVDREYTEQYDAVPDDFEWLFEKLVSWGRRPSAVAAALYYLEHDVIQREAADRFGTTPLSIRNTLKAIGSEFPDCVLAERYEMVRKHTPQ